MKRRTAFTLIEIMVALVVTGLVVTLAYAAAQAGIDTGTRLSVHRESTEGAITLRAMLSDALRHGLEGVRGGPAVFRLVDRVAADGSPDDSLVFVTRGVEAPLGASSTWAASIFLRGGAVVLVASPLDSRPGSQPLHATLDGIAGLDIHALGRSSASSWSPMWPDSAIAPEAVRVVFAGASGEPLGVPLVVRVGLERTP